VSLSGIYADTTLKMWYEMVSAAGRYVEKVMGRNPDGSYRVPNPCKDADKPKVVKRKRRYFNDSEVFAIIRACKAEEEDSGYEQLLIATLIDSACRVGELVGLRGGDVGNGFVTVTGKTGERRYRLSKFICERLHKLAGGDDKPVFYRRDGEFYPSGNGLARRVRYIIERAGIKGKKIGVHTIRHTSASWVAQKGGEALIVKALLQHDDIKTSMGYIHDVDDLVIRDDTYSPLRLLNERISKAVPVGLLGNTDVKGEALVPVQPGSLVEVEGSTLVNDLFPDVKDGVAVRTVLQAEDLRLIRRVLIFYARYNDGSDIVRARALMRRMFRKGGSKFYARDKCKE